MTYLVPVENEPILSRQPLVRGIEIAVFVALSVALHIALVSRPMERGTKAPVGERGMVFQGASPSLAALVEHWSEALPTPYTPEPLTDPGTKTDHVLQPNSPDPTPVRSPSPEPVLDRSVAPRHITEFPAEPDPTVQPEVPSSIPRTPLSGATPSTVVGQPSLPLSTPLQPQRLVGASALSEPPPRVPDLPEVSGVRDTEGAPLPTPKPTPQTARRPLGDRDTKRTTSSARRKPEVASESQSAARGGASAPDSTPARTSARGLSEAERLSLLQELGARVLAAIARERHYPRSALRRRVEGTATLRVTIDRSGRLVSLAVRRSSGQRILDDAASDAARSVHRFPQAPSELSGGPFTFLIPVRFTVR